MKSPATPDPRTTTESGLSLQTRLIALVVAVTFFMENLDATVIATALPIMASAFGITPVDMNVGITAYILAVAIFIPLSSWIADRFGARRVFAGAIVVFTLASLLCGLSQTSKCLFSPACCKASAARWGWPYARRAGLLQRQLLPAFFHSIK